jgi:hypothetical protein
MRKLFLRRLFDLAQKQKYFTVKYIKFIRVLYNKNIKVVILNQFSHKRITVYFYYLPLKEYVGKIYISGIKYKRDRHIFTLTVITEVAKKIETDEKFREYYISKQRDYSKRNT